MRVIRVKRENPLNPLNSSNPFNPLNIIIITGQTSTGKTKLAYKLAKKHNGELISCDSRQVYKKLDIITGKEVFPDIKTHLIDLVDPKEQFSSFDYAFQAKNSIIQMIKQGITPIIVGGSYLYLKHLLYGIDTNVPANWKLRDKLNKKSVKQLQNILKKKSGQTFEQLNQSDRNNPHRLIRKIEIVKFTGPVKSFPPISARDLQKQNQLRADGSPSSLATRKFIGLRFKNYKDMKKRVEKRVEQRLQDGALQEVKHLLKLGYKPTDPGLNTIGYKQLINYYLGTISKDRAIEQWITKELQYAKRQYTFMKKNPDINWEEV